MNKNSVCPVCSTSLNTVRHAHLTDLSRLNGNVRNNLLFSSSTLVNVQHHEKVKAIPNFYFSFIIGGKINDVCRNFIQASRQWTSPQNILIAVGINDIWRKSTVKLITDLENLVEVIKMQNNENRVVLSTLLYAPRYCHSSLPRHANLTGSISFVNRFIRKYNKENTELSLDLSKYGLKQPVTQSSPIMFNYNAWREPSVRDMLHLKYDAKVDIAAEIFTIFSQLSTSNDQAKP